MSAIDDPNETKTLGAWGTDQDRPRKVVIPQVTSAADDIPTIPDIDDLADNISRDVSIPKLNSSAMYEELDSELLKQYSYSSLDGINMAPLLKFIHPDVHTKEPDVVWNIDSLFTDLSETFNKERKVK